MKPTANQVARAATLAAHVGYTYDELDCQAFVEHCVRQAGGRMDYLGTNDMARRAAWLGTLDEARAQGRLVPGAGLLIREATEANLPARYAGDGLGDFSHVGLYVGENALTDTDKNGRRRACDVVHSSATMGRVAGSTLQNGWTHALWFSEIDYGTDTKSAEGDDAYRETRCATVISQDGNPVKLRSTPSTDKPYLAKVPVGTAVEVMQDAQGWAQVRLSSGQVGYMMTKFLAFEGAEDVPESGQDEPSGETFEAEVLDRLEGIQRTLDAVLDAVTNG